jgi:hypothetical protein
LPDEDGSAAPPNSQDSEQLFSASSRRSDDPTSQPLWRAALQHLSKRPRPSDFTAFFGRSTRVPPGAFRSAPASPFGLGKPVKG